MVLAGVVAPLGVEDGVQREGRVPLHNVGQFQTWRENRVDEGPPTLRAVARSVRLLSAPVLCDTLPAEVVLATEADRVLVDTEADGTEELVLQRASHLNALTASGIYEVKSEELCGLGLDLERVDHWQVVTDWQD